MTVKYSKHVRGIAKIYGKTCRVHGGIEMKNVCDPEPTLYCSQWDGTLDDNDEPNCRFEEEA